MFCDSFRCLCIQFEWKCGGKLYKGAYKLPSACRNNWIRFLHLHLFSIWIGTKCNLFRLLVFRYVCVCVCMRRWKQFYLVSTVNHSEFCLLFGSFFYWNETSLENAFEHSSGYLLYLLPRYSSISLPTCKLIIWHQRRMCWI